MNEKCNLGKLFILHNNQLLRCISNVFYNHSQDYLLLNLQLRISIWLFESLLIIEILSLEYLFCEEWYHQRLIIHVFVLVEKFRIFFIKIDTRITLSIICSFSEISQWIKFFIAYGYLSKISIQNNDNKQ